MSADVVPNARRDGFEENKAWRAIQDELRPHLKTLTSSTYKASRSRSAKFNELKQLVRSLTDTVEQRLAGGGVDAGNQQALLVQVSDVTERLSKEVSKDLITEDEAKTIRLLQASVNESRRRLEKAVATGGATAPTVGVAAQEGDGILKIVYAVLQELLEPTLYRDARREIERRLALSTAA